MSTLPVQRFVVEALYSQIHLDDGEVTEPSYFADARESGQGFSPRRNGLAIATPGDTGHCEVELYVGAGPRAADDLDGCVQAISAPLRVGPVLGIQSVAGPPERVIAPPGDYDVLARFYPTDSIGDGTPLRNFRLVIELLPRGALGARCYRLEWGTPPTTLVDADDVRDD